MELKSLVISSRQPNLGIINRNPQTFGYKRSSSKILEKPPENHLSKSMTFNFLTFFLFKMCNLCFTMISWALLFFLTPRIFWSSAATTSFTCWGVGLFFSTFAWGANLGHSAVGGGKEAWSYHVFVCFSSCGKRISMGNGGFSKRWRILQLWSCGATCRYLFSGLM